MKEYLVRITAGNFDASVYDTDDLSTIRGGGIANLVVPGLILKELEGSGLGTLSLIYEGASQAVGLLTSSVSDTTIEAYVDDLATQRSELKIDDKRIASVLPHLTVIGAAVEVSGDHIADSRRVVARTRRRQLQRLTLDLGEPPSQSIRRPCEIDRTRGATCSIQVGGDTFQVSESVAARRELGRALRQKIYADILRSDASTVPEMADSLEDLVADPPDQLPPALSGKMAVVHMDGNKFTRVRAQAIMRAGAGGVAEARRAEHDFSDYLKERRARLLARIVDELSGEPRTERSFRGRKLRFETLLWGGDEATFVLPAWKVRDLLGILAGELDRDWSFHGQPLTHAVGILVCSYKMPVATARSLVLEIVDDAKAALGAQDSDNGDLSGLDNVLSLHMVESIEPPAGELRAFRRRQYGTDDPRAFALVGMTELRSLLEAGDRVTNPQEGFPRSQLFGLLSNASRERSPGAETSPDDMRREWDNDLLRAMVRSDTLEFKPDLDRLLSTSQRYPPQFGMTRLAELWEVLRPFVH